MSDTLIQDTATAAPKPTAKNYATDMEVRWCPGCGDYAIIKAVQKTLADLQVPADRTAFISGIGCAARFPYYVETYGFHTIHGRAATIATGAKLGNPDLDIWVVSGDGDSLSIGGNHLLHLLRRNVDLVYLLFNNEIYGLTKGQASPTSPVGQRSPSTPRGSIDNPVHAVAFALGAGAKFIARATDVGQPVLVETLKRAHGFKGTGFVEILQNCIVYNDGAFDRMTDKRTAADHQVVCRHGERLLYGRDKQYGLRLDTKTLKLEPFTLGEGGLTEDDAMIHDETNPTLAGLLGALEDPVAVGVLYAVEAPTYDGSFVAGKPPQQRSLDRLQELVTGKDTWIIGGEG